MRIESAGVNDMSAKCGDVVAGTDNAGDFMAMLMAVLVPGQNNAAGQIFQSQPDIVAFSGSEAGTQGVIADNAMTVPSFLVTSPPAPGLPPQAGPETAGGLPAGDMEVPAGMDLLAGAYVLPVNETGPGTGAQYTQPGVSTGTNILPENDTAWNAVTQNMGSGASAIANILPPDSGAAANTGVQNVQPDEPAAANILPGSGVAGNTGAQENQSKVPTITGILPGDAPAANISMAGARTNLTEAVVYTPDVVPVSEGAAGKTVTVTGQPEAGAIIGQPAAETGDELQKPVTARGRDLTGMAAELTAVLTAGSNKKEATGKVNSNDTGNNLPLKNEDQKQVEAVAVKNPAAGQEQGNGQMSGRKTLPFTNHRPEAKALNEQPASTPEPGREPVAGIKVNKTGWQGAAAVNDITAKDKTLSNTANNITANDTTTNDIATNNVPQVKQTAFAQLKPEVPDMGGAQVKQAPQIVLRAVTQLMNHLDNKDGSAATTIRLKLEPKQLGELTVRLSYARGELTAHFYTSSVMARDAVEGTLPQLREILSQQNIQLNDAAAFVGQEDSRQPGQQRYQQQGNANPYFTNNGDDSPFPERMQQDTAGMNDNLDRLV
ncbi:flagellar hook-length control protein FliK [Desulfocucumis palustris]|uniref:Flagellar hook-length control protein FliK n=1 Tax=Desulfocucumis palustris TaxID=1898651 RepID=A0A2L2XBX5_9FIRM|nr:flagellar hook-length control protein FliK [Desulfocucumis palustris]GBF33193.1 flagellar hook-length control protein FliK [Desulfocucumis palustris]